MPLLASRVLVESSDGMTTAAALMKAALAYRASQLKKNSASGWRGFIPHRFSARNNSSESLNRLRHRELLQLIAEGDTTKVNESLKRTDSIRTYLDRKTVSGQSALYIAVCKGLDQIVALLLEHGADVDQRNCGEYTALHAACEHEQEGAVRMLLKHQANVDLMGPDGVRAIHFATQKGFDHIVNILIQYKADIDAEICSSGLTSLMIAAQLGHINVVQTLIRAGADIHAEDNKGNSALHFAAQEGKYQTCCLLLAAGADPYMPNIEEDTPVDLADYHGYSHVVYILEFPTLNLSTSIVTDDQFSLGMGGALNDAFLRNRPDIAPIIVKNRMKYARFYDLGRITEEAS
ncbi:unnamed protein product [Albugo candida]|uniref:Uncharacterized protein n=1 Tax=Albugo candida TaxID=65357 RepID=A0A024GAJ5_9STRA|nr:unnamed protein product [Albugo candida]|eukprot:CCI43560.1 unnamed protein product [Albugo candida]